VKVYNAIEIANIPKKLNGGHNPMSYDPNNPIRKAVFPVAGLGTRFLPATKANPKEMLPIVDKPVIQYAVEEAIECGIKELIFITSISKRSIEDHFDSNFELETKLAETGKKELLNTVQNMLPKDVFCVYIRQYRPLGLGHAVLCARDVVGNEPFALFLADDLIDGGEKSCLAQMIDVYKETKSSILALQKVTEAEVEKYGIVGMNQKEIQLGKAAKINNIVEKPKPNKAPSRYASVGRYILTPKVFTFLQNVKPGAIGEIQITDGILQLMKVENVYGYMFEGTRYDCGNKLGYLEAVVSYARRHPEIGKDFEKYLTKICREEKHKK
jgi:UTP--glucose-1-phosphate uridylyltransferase